MDYATIKLLHQSAVALSGLGFAARGLASLRGARWPQSRVAKTLPHLLDTCLLVSAIALAYQLRLSPTDTSWLQAKIAALFGYIGLGMVALRPRFRWGHRCLAWVMALLVYGWMVSVAVLKNAQGLFSLLT